VLQQMFDMPQYGPWHVTLKGDRSCRLLADRHYSRQHVGAPMFTGPGRNLYSGQQQRMRCGFRSPAFGMMVCGLGNVPSSEMSPNTSVAV
jgi:hypothetical protein